MLVILMLLNHAGRSNLASILLVGTLVILFYLSKLLILAGPPLPLILLTVIAIMMSGLLLGSRAPIITALLLGLQHAVIVSLNSAGFIVPQAVAPPPRQNIIVTSVSYLLIGFLLRLVMVRIQTVVDRTRAGEKNYCQATANCRR